jgi:hypothetical protein
MGLHHDFVRRISHSLNQALSSIFVVQMDRGLNSVVAEWCTHMFCVQGDLTPMSGVVLRSGSESIEWPKNAMA